MNILVVASHGGHLKQAVKIFKSFDQNKITYCTTVNIEGMKYCRIPDCNFDGKLKVIWTFTNALLLIARIKPTHIVTTGAAPGFLVLVAGRILGVKHRVWIDSIANSDQLSKSGKFAKYCATHWYTQWEHLQTNDGPKYLGAIL